MSPPSSLVRPQPPVSAPSRRLPSTVIRRALRHTVGSWLGTDTFPALSHRSLPWCRRPYAGEPCECTRPIPSPQTLAFAQFQGARRSHAPQLALSTPQQAGGSWWIHITTLQRSLHATAPRLACPLSQPTSPAHRRAVGYVYIRAFTPQGHPRDVPDMTTWAHRTTPRTGLSPAGSMLLRAALEQLWNNGGANGRKRSARRKPKNGLK